MRAVYLLKEYDGHRGGEIIHVSTNVAFGLVENGIARNTTPSDFMVKSEIGVTKAFSSSPSKKDSRKNIVS